MYQLFREYVDGIARRRDRQLPGAAAYDLALVAQGVYDGFFEKRLKPWDTAAGALLVQEAGGIITDYTGQKYSPMYPDVVAASPVLHADLLSAVAGS